MAENFMFNFHDMTVIFPICSREMWVVPVGVMFVDFAALYVGGTFIKQLHDLYKKVALSFVNRRMTCFFVFCFSVSEKRERREDTRCLVVRYWM